MIPKVIHYCWFGGGKIPADLQKCIDSWKRIMPDWEIRLWNEYNYDITTCEYMKEAYEARKWGFVSDYARLDICFRHGGIYLDTDVEAVKPFDNLINLEAFCGFEQGRGKSPDYVGTGLGFGCRKGHEMIGKMRDYYIGMHFIKPDSSLDLTPCPVINTRFLLSEGLKLNNEKQNINGLTVLPYEYFCPMNQYTGILTLTRNTYSIHHYSASWCSEADQEFIRLRMKYRSKFGRWGAEVISLFIAYKKHYGALGMWKYIFEKVMKRFKNASITRNQRI